MDYKKEYAMQMKLALSKLESAFSALREANQNGEQFDFATSADESLDKIVNLVTKFDKIWYQK